MFFALFLSRLFDPLVIILALVAGIRAREWWHVAAAALAIPGIEVLALAATQGSRPFNPEVFGLGGIAAAAWIGLVVFAKKWRANRADSI